jgi:hypothetical protein
LSVVGLGLVKCDGVVACRLTICTTAMLQGDLFLLRF